jgi:hypothetical protein
VAVNSAMGGISGPNGGPCTQQVYRFRNDPVKASLYPIASSQWSLTPATQRRRVRRVTRN